MDNNNTPSAAAPSFQQAQSDSSEANSPGDPALEDQIRQSNNQIGTVVLYGVPIVSLTMENKERLCLAQISSTLLKDYSYNEIHNRRVALGITCAQCTPVQLELLRRAGAMPVTSRRCGMITRREAERLCKSFLGDHSPPKLPENFAFDVSHCCAWGCRGAFLPSRYNSSRAKCIKCFYCSLFFSPNKFIFHSHRSQPDAKYVQPDAANFNSWRRHIHLTGSPPDQVIFAWEDVKAMFNGGSRKRVTAGNGTPTPANESKADPAPPVKVARISNKKSAMSNKTNHSARINLEATPSTSAPIVPGTVRATNSIQHQHTNILARLNSIAPVVPAVLKPASDSPSLIPAADYWTAAAGSRLGCWPTYPALPFHPAYSYYNYLISKSDQLMQQINPVGWQQRNNIQSTPHQEPRFLDEEDEDEEPFVDVESTI